MVIKEPPSFTVEGAKCDTTGKDPGFEKREGVGEDEGSVPAGVGDRRGGVDGEGREGRGGTGSGMQLAGLSGRHCGP